MSSRPVIDDHAPRPPEQGRAPEDARVSGDALDAELAALSDVEAQALRWLVRREDGWDAATEADFQAWFRADPAHRAAFADMAGAWEGIDEIPADGVARLRAGMHPLAVATPSVVSPPAQRPAWKSVQSGRAGWFAWAPGALAACVAVALLGGGWLGWDRWQQQPVFSQHYASARGQQLESRLPDGSLLRLDTASQADVTLYRQRREVRLPEGQIMFTVQGDKARPFDVLAGRMRITVVGTRFSVRYTPSLGSQQVQVAVEEGHVRVARADAAKQEDGRSGVDAIELTAGQTVAADGEGRLGPVVTVAAERIAPWRGHRVNFDNTPLAAALAELERYGDTGLRVRDPAVAALRVTGSVDLRRVGDFARSLPHVLPVRLAPREKGVDEVVSARP